MRGVECAVPNCAHMHADDDEQLVQEVMKHAASVHPDMDFPEETGRQLVEVGAYDDTRHAQTAGDAQATQ
jgi:predicted small metal-binding protein